MGSFALGRALLRQRLSRTRRQAGVRGLSSCMWGGCSFALSRALFALSRALFALSRALFALSRDLFALSRALFALSRAHLMQRTLLLRQPYS